MGSPRIGGTSVGWANLQSWQADDSHDWSIPLCGWLSSYDSRSRLLRGSPSRQVAPTAESSRTDGGDDLGLNDQPLYAALSGQIGYTYEELDAASSRQQASLARDCLAKKGFAVAIEDLDTSADAPDQRPLVYSAIEDISSGIVNTSPLDAIPPIAVEECTANGTGVIFQLLTLVGSATQEISARVQADSDWISASTSERKCVEPLLSRLEDANSRIFDADVEVIDIVESVKERSTTPSAALSRLQQIQGAIAPSEELQRVADSCSDERRAVEARLVAQYQAAFLEEHPGFVSEISEQFAKDIDKLTDLLPAR